jgi:hypothetical protein
VRELAFDAGALTSSTDRTAEAGAARDRLGASRPGPSDQGPVEDWIRRTFSLSLNDSVPS